MRNQKKIPWFPFGWAAVLVAFLLGIPGATATGDQAMQAQNAIVAVGPQYDSTHVYVPPTI